MKNQYPVIKKICAECRKTRLIACVLWSVATIIFLAAGGLGVFSMTAPVRSLFSATPKELAGRFVTAKVEQVITPYMSYGTGEALANTTYMEFIIEAADNTYCAVRLSGRKMRQMYSASQTDGMLDEPITIYGKMGKMPRDSAEFYEQTLKEALGSDEVPAEFTKYLIIDEGAYGTGKVTSYVMIAGALITTLLASISFIRAFDGTAAAQVQEMIENSENEQETAQKLDEFWENATRNGAFRMDGEYFCCTVTGKAQLFRREDIIEYGLSQNYRLFYIKTADNKNAHHTFRVNPYLATTIMHIFKETEKTE